MKSNCNIEAGKRFRNGHAPIMWITRTEHSYYGEYAEKSWWRLLLRPVGVAIEWAGWLLLQGGSFLQTGRWLHAGWIAEGKAWEFAPEAKKQQKRFPPIRYEGAVFAVGKWVPGTRSHGAVR